MDTEALISKYYNEGPLKELLLVHSRLVANKCRRIMEKHPELEVDKGFVIEAAMLHDIGIFRTNAPRIYCMGTEPYLLHGKIGAELLRAEGLPRHARVCERHTGAGLSAEAILAQNLPLPAEDLLPETLEEEMVCYADKFFSKTHLTRERDVAGARRSLEDFGEDGLVRFDRWVSLFE